MTSPYRWDDPAPKPEPVAWTLDESESGMPVHRFVCGQVNGWALGDDLDGQWGVYFDEDGDPCVFVGESVAGLDIAKSCAEAALPHILALVEIKKRGRG